MAYTVWSADTLLGETELELPSARPGMRTGTFHPTDAGKAVMPTFLELLTAGFECGSMLQREGITRERFGESLGQAVHDALQRSPEGRRAAAANAAVAALRLELRDSSGEALPVKQIVLNDSLRFAGAFGALPAEVSAEVEAAGLAHYVVSVLL